MNRFAPMNLKTPAGSRQALRLGLGIPRLIFHLLGKKRGEWQGLTGLDTQLPSGYIHSTKKPVLIKYQYEKAEGAMDPEPYSAFWSEYESGAKKWVEISKK